jgi:hypothetical protein
LKGWQNQTLKGNLIKHLFVQSRSIQQNSVLFNRLHPTNNLPSLREAGGKILALPENSSGVT